MTERLAVLLAALALDRLVGEPDALWRRLPHPVVLFGRAIGAADRWLNRDGWSEGGRALAGLAAILVLLVLAAAAGAGLEAVARALPLGEALVVAAAAVLLAHKSLVEHVAAVADGLADGGLEGGRRAVGLIVGRDPAMLDEAGVARAAVESAAENFSDGVVAPAVWFAILGLPGLLAYKMLNTADSMIGHRTPRHRAFGRAAARLDDLANLVPARLSALLLLLAGGAAGRQGLRTVLSDAPRHRSPNAGWPEAAMAAALGLALGGPRRYGGEGEVAGAWLNGDGRRAASAADIRRALAVLDRAGLLHGALYALLLAAALIA